MNIASATELVEWKQQAQLKRQNYIELLSKMINNEHLYNKNMHRKLLFWIKSLGHELFLIETFLEEEFKEVGINEIKQILAYDI